MALSKSDPAYISNLLLTKNEAVERAMLVLNLKDQEEYRRSYYAAWIKSGKKLTGHHLDTAREIALRHTDTLTKLAAKQPISKRSDPNATLTMARQGIFHIHTFGTSHCGIGKEMDVKYAAVIKCGAVTDHRGFLFDQINVDGYFQNVKRTSLSCEKLAMHCTKGLVSMIQKENPGAEVHALELTLSPAPFAAAMTYAWKL